MSGLPSRLLPVGIALTGALLGAAGLPHLSTSHDAATTTEHAVLLAAAPVPTVTTPAPVTASTLTHIRRTPVPVRTVRPVPVRTLTPVPVRTAPARPVVRKAVTTTPIHSVQLAEPTPGQAVRQAPVANASLAASSCSGDGWQQRRGEQALRSLKPAAGNGYLLRFLGAKTGFYGLTRPSLQAVEVYVRACSQESDELLAHVLAHELGHAYDKTRLTDDQRAAYKAARGIPASTPWFGCSRCTDFATPAGDFAEVYSQWRRGASTNRSQIGNAPSQAGLNALAQRFFGA